MESPALRASNQDCRQETPPQEATLPGWVSSKRPLPKNEGLDTHVIARGYISRGGAKRGRARAKPDANLPAV